MYKNNKGVCNKRKQFKKYTKRKLKKRTNKNIKSKTNSIKKSNLKSKNVFVPSREMLSIKNSPKLENNIKKCESDVKQKEDTHKNKQCNCEETCTCKKQIKKTKEELNFDLYEYIKSKAEHDMKYNLKEFQTPCNIETFHKPFELGKYPPNSKHDKNEYCKSNVELKYNTCDIKCFIKCLLNLIKLFHSIIDNDNIDIVIEGIQNVLNLMDQYWKNSVDTPTYEYKLLTHYLHSLLLKILNDLENPDLNIILLLKNIRKEGLRMCKFISLILKNVNIYHTINKYLNYNCKFDNTETDYINFNKSIQNDKIAVWIIKMSEEQYYNTSRLLICNQEDEFDIRVVLLNNINEINEKYIKNHWINVQLIKQGCFGHVYSAYDTLTNKTIAIKYITKQDINILNYKKLLNYIQEHNNIFNAHDSLFIVRLLYAFEMNNNYRSLMFIFEFCIGDLKMLMNNLKQYTNIDPIMLLATSNESCIINTYEELSKRFDISLKEIIIIYCFEILCIIDYLTKSNIIHRDLKMNNFMISEKLHLKLGDFGLVLNTNYLTEPNEMHIVSEAEYDFINLFKDNKCLESPLYYLDIESCYYIMSHHYPNALDLFDYKLGLLYKLEGACYTNNFLTNIWSVGWILLNLIFIGNQINCEEIIKQTEMKLPKLVYTHPCALILMLTATKRYAIPLFIEGIPNLLCNQFGELSNLIKSILQPRSRRCQDYLNSKLVTYYNIPRNLSYLDMNKIEKIDIFSEFELTKQNVFLKVLPEVLRNFVQPLISNNYDSTDKFLNELKYIDIDYKNNIDHLM